MMKKRRSPPKILLEIFEEIDKRNGKAGKTHLLMGVFGGNRDQFRAWIEGFCIQDEGFLKKTEKNGDIFYQKTDRGQNMHDVKKSRDIEKLFEALSGKKLTRIL